MADRGFSDGFEYDLGEIVRLDPVGDERGLKGKIVGRVQFIDGSFAYFVSTVGLVSEGIARHLVMAAEIAPAGEG